MPQLFSQVTDFVSGLSPEAVGAAFPAVLLVYVLATVIYRAWLHPISHVPGPFLAKVTWLYEWWYGRVGKMHHQIDKLHKIYGPVVRITPDEVHVNDLSNIDTFDRVYKVGTKFTKDDSFYSRFNGTDVAFFARRDNNVHRQLRASFSHCMTRKRILALEPIVRNHINHMCDLIETASEKDAG